MNTITTAQAADFLMGRDNFLILTHVRPDGDTLGCAAGLCRALRQVGKTAYVMENEGVISLFAPYVEELFAPADFVPGTVVAVDIAALDLIPDNAESYKDKVDLTIDHHPSQEFYAGATCLDST